jgi:hypothetical protein
MLCLHRDEEGIRPRGKQTQVKLTRLFAFAFFILPFVPPAKARQQPKYEGVYVVRRDIELHDALQGYVKVR